MTLPAYPQRGEPMYNTKEGWRRLAQVYAVTIETQREEIIQLKMKVNKLEQRKC